MTAPAAAVSIQSKNEKAALWYAQRGWHVFPVAPGPVVDGRCSCGKSDCTSPGKHPLIKGWQKRASTDPNVISKWWAKWPDASVGIATGEVSGFFVLDIDGDKGKNSLRALISEHGSLLHTVVAQTGKGGHYYFSYTHPIQNKTGIRPGIDIRGNGGYVIAPPSVHPSGAVYTFKHDPSETELADAPDWLYDLKKEDSTAGPIGGLGNRGPIKKGERDDTLYKYGCSLRAAGGDEGRISGALIKINNEQCKPPLHMTQIVKLIRQVLKHPIGQARQENLEQDADWPEPEPLRRQTPPGESYPVQALGNVLEPMVTAMMEITKAPDAICAQSVLAAATLAVQAYGDVEIDGRRYPLSNYFITVAETGERKSACDREALAPNNKYQRDQYTTYQDELAAHEIESMAWKKARDEALASKSNRTREAKQQAVEDLGPEPKRPPCPILTCEEPTFEGLTKALANDWPSMGIFSDEGGRFLGGHGMNRENQLKTAAGLSKLWDGSPVTRTRSGDGNSILYGRRVSMHLMVQPVVGDFLFGNGLLLKQGLPSRCLVAFPKSTMGTREYTEAAIRDHPATIRYFARITDILKTALPLADGSVNVLEPRVITIDPEAKTIWVAFHNHVEKMIGEGQPLSTIKGLAAKLAEHALRLAAVLALVNDIKAEVVTGRHIKAGIALAEHYANEALRLFEAMTVDPDLQLAERLLHWLQTRERSRFSHVATNVYLREIYQFGPRPIRDKATALRIMRILEGHGWVKHIKGGQKGSIWEIRQ